MPATHLLVCALALGSALAASAQQADPAARPSQQQRPSAADIPPLPLILFTSLGNALAWAAGNDIQATTGQLPLPNTVGEFFTATQKRLAQNIIASARQAAEYGQAFKDEAAGSIKFIDPPATQSRAATPEDGPAAINNVCKIFNDYKKAPLILVEPTRDESVNALLASVCATADKAAAAGPSARTTLDALAELPLKDAVAQSLEKLQSALAAANAGAKGAVSPGVASAAGPAQAGGAIVQKLVQQFLSQQAGGAAAAASP